MHSQRVAHCYMLIFLHYGAQCAGLIRLINKLALIKFRDRDLQIFQISFFESVRVIEFVRRQRFAHFACQS